MVLNMNPPATANPLHSWGQEVHLTSEPTEPMRAFVAKKATHAQGNRPCLGRDPHQPMRPWVTREDIASEFGGIRVSAGSHRRMTMLRGYDDRDVDAFFENKLPALKIPATSEPTGSSTSAASRHPPSRSRACGKPGASRFKRQAVHRAPAGHLHRLPLE
jgi:hypothetical protein